jgi:hypothetical protein
MSLAALRHDALVVYTQTPEPGLLNLAAQFCKWQCMCVQ